MPVPELPRVGAVIRYAYLWHREARAGAIEGRKDRLCLMLAVAPPTDGVPGRRIAVCSITHTAPSSSGHAPRLPARTKTRLGLDTEASSLVADEINVFVCPGFDLRPTPSGAMCFGDLAPALTEQAKALFATARSAGTGRTAPASAPPRSPPGARLPSGFGTPGAAAHVAHAAMVDAHAASWAS